MLRPRIRRHASFGYAARRSHVPAVSRARDRDRRIVGLDPQGVHAGQTIDVNTLNPVPPAAYTCMGTGSGAICRASRTEDLSGPSGFLCGDAASPIELVGVDALDRLRFTRIYNADLNLVTRTVHEHFSVTFLNPVTGLTVEGTQISAVTSTFTTPGDVDSGTFAQRGVVKFFVPGAGVLLIDVGRAVLTTDRSVLVESGRHQLDQYFGGDTSVLEGVCEAVGSPGTPPLP
jgi:hypothetical protein